MKGTRSSVQLPRLCGIRFRVVAGRLRSMYQQVDGEWELADCCTCPYDWEPFRVVRRMDCEIDEHKLAARRELEAAA
jgi:hypothetical protein